MQFSNQYLDFSCPQVMGILNVTPDSFSDGGQHAHIDKALEHAEKMIAQGASIIDVGGESTRPGAVPVSLQEELDRVIPVVEALASNSDCVISVDTSKADVMRHAVKAGATLINDVRALQEPGALNAALECNVPVCLMHMQGQPTSMQADPSYNNVVEDVKAFLQTRINACIQAGIKQEHIILDPGFGFGKTLEHNYVLLKHLRDIISMGYPVLVGMSRKSMIGNLLNRDVDDRLAGSITLATIAAQIGAHIIRVHDVQETSDAIKIVNMLSKIK